VCKLSPHISIQTKEKKRHFFSIPLIIINTKKNPLKNHGRQKGERLTMLVVEKKTISYCAGTDTKDA